MQNLLSDLRYALRSLRIALGFTTAAVVTLALGVGVNTAIFSVVNTVLIQKLPYKDSDRIVLIYETEPELAKAPVTMPDLIDWRERARTLQAISSLQPRYAVLSGGTQAERISAVSVTVDLFNTLGVQPVLGRAFTPEEAQSGRNNVVILGDALFRRRYGADPGVIGRQILIEGGLFTVVGVAPPALSGSTILGLAPRRGYPWCWKRMNGCAAVTTASLSGA
jgi:hypothetical protein